MEETPTYGHRQTVEAVLGLPIRGQDGEAIVPDKPGAAGKKCVAKYLVLAGATVSRRGTVPADRRGVWCWWWRWSNVRPQREVPGLQWLVGDDRRYRQLRSSLFSVSGA
jgi:hypothetical protein